MKSAIKTYILALASITLTLTGCRTEKNEPLTLDKSQITMSTGEQTMLTPQPAGRYEWSSSNDFAVEVSSEGLVSAKFVGQSTIVVSTGDGRKATCRVNIEPRFNYFQEPILSFGAHPREITDAEKRRTTLESNTLVIYADTNPTVNRLYYIFGDSGLRAAAIELYRDVLSDRQFDDFMSERYRNKGIVDQMQCYTDQRVAIYVEQTDTLRIVRYFDNSTAGKAAFDALSRFSPISLQLYR